jgi:hypothetical protein
MAKRSTWSWRLARSSAMVAMAALEEDNLLRNASGDGGGETALTRRDAGEVPRVALVEGCHAADCAPHHGARHGQAGSRVRRAGTGSQAREDKCAGVALDPCARCAVGAAGDAQDAKPDAKLVD